AVNASSFSVSSTYTSTLDTLLRADYWTRDQRIRLSLNAGFQGGATNASIIWRGQANSASAGALNASSIVFNARVRGDLAGVQLSTSAEAEYDLITSQLVRLEADAMAAMRGAAILNGD